MSRQPLKAGQPAGVEGKLGPFLRDIGEQRNFAGGRLAAQTLSAGQQRFAIAEIGVEPGIDRNAKILRACVEQAH